MKTAAVAAGLATGGLALNNGLGVTPQLGYNSWYDVLMNPSQDALLKTAQALTSTGLAALGYKYVNLDDGIVAGRYANGTLQPDPKFPNGMRYVADQVRLSWFVRATIHGGDGRRSDEA